MTGRIAPAMMLGQLLGGLSATGPRWDQFSVDEIQRLDDETVRANVYLLSGDVFELTVRWVEEDSP